MEEVPCRLLSEYVISTVAEYKCYYYSAGDNVEEVPDYSLSMLYPQLRDTSAITTVYITPNVGALKKTKTYYC